MTRYAATEPGARTRGGATVMVPGEEQFVAEQGNREQRDPWADVTADLAAVRGTLEDRPHDISADVQDLLLEAGECRSVGEAVAEQAVDDLRAGLAEPVGDPVEQGEHVAAEASGVGHVAREHRAVPAVCSSAQAASSRAASRAAPRRRVLLPPAGRAVPDRPDSSRPVVPDRPDSRVVGCASAAGGASASGAMLARSVRRNRLRVDASA
ncbi:MAG TPA: hypothetical protein VMV92_44595 [Streptosporangiaceae bacterium]|nr:hypothetical protein [Streptosporangiaceae bacterium]